MAGRIWTAREDQIVKSNSISDAIKLLKRRRTATAVRSRQSKSNVMREGLTKHNKWTEAEDLTVTFQTIEDAVDLLRGSRTRAAILCRRKLIGVAVPKNLWSKIEDRRVHKTASLSIEKASKFFKNRTAIAILNRRSQLGCTRKCGPKIPWKCTEIRLLQQKWPTCKRSELPSAFPRHTPKGVWAKARNLGLKKTKTFDATDLLDQIRLRAREDGISLQNLAAESGCGLFFLRRRPMINFNRLARVVAFFGGCLAIDWCDE